LAGLGSVLLQTDMENGPQGRDRSVSPYRIGTAGWSIPAAHAARFPGPGSHLERYARVFPAVEIDSSFYRPHRVETYRRWAASVPDAFRFAVKLPGTVTHAGRLRDLEALDRFLDEVAGLGDKLGALLVQLPPRLAFDAASARACFAHLRRRFEGEVACEPRHASWFEATADALLAELRIGRVAADPPPVAGAGRPGGWTGTVYYRLHGSPVRYASAYPDAFLEEVARELVRDVRSRRRRPVWCIFDNTARGEAIPNALVLLGALASHAARREPSP
jgi:uncharacterized protein YecE (DUF72 family)